ncbi:MAG: hypothetical protein O2821_11005 [Chloroflexi bacterium]|nr:hypothetical protein [Chloroflexota bacterium]
MTTTSLERATSEVAEEDLERMALEQKDLLSEFKDYKVGREGPLTNKMMADQGFPGSSAKRFQKIGRINGYMREFNGSSTSGDGTNFMAATVVHLFDSPESVHTWMHDVFLHDFEENIGTKLDNEEELVAVERLEPKGFFDEAVALKALHNEDDKLVSVTIVDFRLGRLLGVAFVGTHGDHQRLDLATQLGTALEKNMVRIALG